MQYDDQIHHIKNENNVLSKLLDIQNKFGYLPEEELERIAKESKAPMTQIYSLATFYNAFSLKPKGENVIKICMGTACHVRGGPRILDRVKQILGIETGETTKDSAFTLETVNCLGTCALGPLVVVNDNYHSNVITTQTEKLINKYRNKV